MDQDRSVGRTLGRIVADVDRRIEHERKIIAARRLDVTDSEFLECCPITQGDARIDQRPLDQRVRALPFAPWAGRGTGRGSSCSSRRGRTHRHARLKAVYHAHRRLRSPWPSQDRPAASGNTVLRSVRATFPSHRQRRGSLAGGAPRRRQRACLLPAGQPLRTPSREITRRVLPPFAAPSSRRSTGETSRT